MKIVIGIPAFMLWLLGTVMGVSFLVGNGSWLEQTYFSLLYLFGKSVVGLGFGFTLSLAAAAILVFAVLFLYLSWTDLCGYGAMQIMGKLFNRSKNDTEQN